jgi:type VI secretion system protein ImpH
VSDLFREPFRYQFVQAVRLLQKESRRREDVGKDFAPADEILRFRTPANLSFPPSEIVELVENSGDGPMRMSVAFMGLVGPSGFCRTPTRELAAERRRFRTRRSTSSWTSSRTGSSRSSIARGRSTGWMSASKNRARTRSRAGCTLSWGSGRGLSNRMAVKDDALLYYAGAISQQPRSQAAIEDILSDYFSVPVVIKPFVGMWLDVPEDGQTRLGQQGSRLGLDVLAGSKVFCHQAKFRVVLGPLTLKQFQSFLPDGDAHKPLSDLTRFLAGPELDFDIQPLLLAQEVPTMQLGGASGPKLGRSWLGTPADTRTLRRPRDAGRERKTLTTRTALRGTRRVRDK